jgi:hypothetical protein
LVFLTTSILFGYLAYESITRARGLVEGFSPAQPQTVSYLVQSGIYVIHYAVYALLSILFLCIAVYLCLRLL